MDEPAVGLNLEAKQDTTVPVEELQFRRAEPVGGTPAGKQCVACKSPIGDTYYHAQGQVVCPLCAQNIEAGQQKPPAVSLLRSVIYGGLAALGGCILYATVAIVTGLGIGLIAIVVGYMVGKAVRIGANGLGGRPQQFLAVGLTYLAITTSHLPVLVHQINKEGGIEKFKERNAKAQQKNGAAPAPAPKPEAEQPPAPVSPGAAIAMLILFFAAAPFIELLAGGNIVNALLGLAIIVFALQQAWKLTGRTDLLVMGPYSDAEGAPAGNGSV